MLNGSFFAILFFDILHPLFNTFEWRAPANAIDSLSRTLSRDSPVYASALLTICNSTNYKSYVRRGSGATAKPPEITKTMNLLKGRSTKSTNNKLQIGKQNYFGWLSDRHSKSTSECKNVKSELLSVSETCLRIWLEFLSLFLVSRQEITWSIRWRLL